MQPLLSLIEEKSQLLKFSGYDTIPTSPPHYASHFTSPIRHLTTLQSTPLPVSENRTSVKIQSLFSNAPSIQRTISSSHHDSTLRPETKYSFLHHTSITPDSGTLHYKSPSYAQMLYHERITGYHIKPIISEPRMQFSNFSYRQKSTSIGGSSIKQPTKDYVTCLPPPESAKKIQVQLERKSVEEQTSEKRLDTGKILFYLSNLYNLL